MHGFVHTTRAIVPSVICKNACLKHFQTADPQTFCALQVWCNMTILLHVYHVRCHYKLQRYTQQTTHAKTGTFKQVFHFMQLVSHVLFQLHSVEMSLKHPSICVRTLL